MLSIPVTPCSATKKVSNMKWLYNKLKELIHEVRLLWMTGFGKILVIVGALLFTVSVPGIYFGFMGTPDNPACLKAENDIEVRTDTWWKTIRHYGFQLAGHPLQCKLNDVDLLAYLKGTLPAESDPREQDGQAKSHKIKSLFMEPGAFNRNVQVLMQNKASTEVPFMQESSDRLKIRDSVGPAAGILSPTTPLEPPGFNWLVWGPALLMVAAMLYMGSRGSMGKMMSFRNSKHKVIMPGQGGPTFDSVAGAEEAKNLLKKYKKFLKDPKRERRLGGRPRKGVLLVGPPGNGKTLLARALAEEAGVPMFTISGSDFTEMFVGVGAARVRDMHAAALKMGNCIIFVDEIDAIGFARKGGSAEGGGESERDGTLMALLNAMDGINEKGQQIVNPDELGIIWIAATNRPEVLDPALKRPGRLDRIVTVPSPGLKHRAAILAIHTGKEGYKLDATVDLTEVARLCAGYSGADLANIANEAANIATDRDADAVYLIDFVEARETIEMGAENRSLIMSRLEVLLTSLHEIGHTLLNLDGEQFGHDPFQKVTNIPRGNALGLTWFRPESDKLGVTKAEIKALMATLMGGRVAEILGRGTELVSSGAAGDMQMAEKRAYQAVTVLGFAESEELEGRAWGSDDTYGQRLSEYDKRLIQAEVTKMTKAATKRAHDHLTEKLQVLFKLTIALYYKETLDRQQVLDLIAEHDAAGSSDEQPELTWEDVVRLTVEADEAKLAAAKLDAQ
jgi:cell division protease FtsH